MIKSARETAWKYTFLVACVRRLRNHDLSSSDEGCKATRVRWINAAWIINSVVEGLWSTWGPRVALIYEALACKYHTLLFYVAINFILVKNYCFSRISELAVSKMDSVIDSVIRKLAETPPPPSSLRAYVFNPAAYISIALATE